MSDPFDPEDPTRKHDGVGIPLLWILIPVVLIFFGIIGMTVYHLERMDFIKQ